MVTAPGNLPPPLVVNPPNVPNLPVHVGLAHIITPPLPAPLKVVLVTMQPLLVHLVTPLNVAHLLNQAETLMV